jgi:hypothetical protein
MKFINKDLHNEIYIRDIVSSPPNAGNHLQSFVNKARENSVAGRFWNEVHRKYWLIRSDISSRCRKELIFQSTTPPPDFTPEETPLPRDKSYFFIFENQQYNINSQFLPNENPRSQSHSTSSPSITSAESIQPSPSTTPGNIALPTVDLDSVRAIFANALCTATNTTLEQKFKGFLDQNDNPFLHLQVKHKVPDFWDKIPMEIVNSATYFNCVNDKPVYFESVKDFVQ